MTLEMDSLHFSYDGREKVLRGLSLDLEDGEIYTLLGGSGSGKTTALKIVAGFLRPSKGRVMIGGRDVTRTPPEKRGVGFVFQNYALFPHMNVRSNIGYGIRGRGSAERIEELMEIFHIDGLQERPVSDLSGGQRQRVALARALAPSPSLLLMDEPLSALDRSLRSDLRKELISILGKMEVTVLYVTHDQEEALDVSDRIGLIVEGKLLEEGSPRSLYSSPKYLETARFMGMGNIMRTKGSINGDLKLPIGSIPWKGEAPDIIGFRVGPSLKGDNGLRVKGRVNRRVFRGGDQLLELDVNGQILNIYHSDLDIVNGDIVEIVIPFENFSPLRVRSHKV